MRSIITIITVLIGICLLTGCHSREQTLKFMKNPHKLHKALQHCSQQKAKTDYCQHVKLTHQVLDEFLKIAHHANHQSWLKHTSSDSSSDHFKQMQALRSNSARIQQQFAKKIMQTQTHLAHLRTKKQHLKSKLDQKNSSKELNKQLLSTIHKIKHTQEKINIMYALVSLNMPTP